MRPHIITLLIAAGLALAGCTKRWEPKSAGLNTAGHACPGKKAPAVTDFGKAGVQSIYLFTISGASNKNIAALIDGMKKTGVEADLGMLMVSINGADTLFAVSEAPLADQAAVDAQFATICAIKASKTYLTHVRYSPIGGAEVQNPVR